MNVSLPHFSIRRPVTVIMLAITMLGLGAIAWYRIPLEFLPKMEFPFIICFIPYPGGTPEQVENEIAIPAEEEFRTINQLKRITSTSNSDGCSIRLQFDWDADMSTAAADVRDRMERLRLKLPAEVGQMFLRRWSSDAIPVVFFTLTTAGSYEELSHLARTVVKSRLLRLDGVADVQVFGKPEQEILIEFDQSVLRSRNLSLYRLVAALQRSNLNLSIGEMTDGRRKYYVRVENQFRGPEDIASLPLGNGTLRVKDVAAVNYRSREIDTDYTIDGRSGVAVMVQKESEANTVAVCRAIEEELERLQQDPLLKDARVFVIFDQSKIITAALDALLDAGKIGALLAIGVLYIFLWRIRPTLLVALSIPTSVVVALVYMFFSGITLNLVTMIALIVALGMLVDNSIVVIENIYRYNSLGYNATESAERGASEVGMAITASTLTTVVVFVPILYLESGQMATYMKQFGMPITVALGASLLVALTLIPLAAAHMKELNPNAGHPFIQIFARYFKKGNSQQVYVLDRAFSSIRNELIQKYTYCISGALRHRVHTLCVLGILLAATVAIPYRKVGMERMPEADQRQVEINLRFEQGFNVESARETVEMLRGYIDKRREELGIKNVFASFSPTDGRIVLFLLQEEDLPPGKTFPYTTEEVRDILWQTLPKQVPGVKLEFEVAKGGEDQKEIHLSLRGDDTRTLAEYAESLKDALLRAVPELSDVKTAEEIAREEIQIKINEALANEAGVSPLVIARTVDFALRGIRLFSLKKEGREIAVWAQFREEDRKNRSNLENVAILTDRNELIPLNQLVSFEKANTPRAIQRENGKSVTSVWAQTRSRDFYGVISQVKEVTSKFRMPRGYTVSMGETIQGMESDMGNFVTALLLSCQLIYIVMAALFESLVFPLSILFTLPLAFIGVWWTLYLFGVSLDTVAMIGIILMAGIVVNNGIVLVDHINRLRNEGMERFDAIIQAGRDRFRPVMMTALTTILGCVPIAVGGSVGSEVQFRSLGLAFIGGLTTGTLLTLVVVPLVYSLLDDLRAWCARFLADLLSSKTTSLSATAPSQPETNS
ncbi:MAG TPA: efflux RND transporter permease subunit [Candidatus Hydrogenedentes bacterium]|nr:efflux RND transporter permease subunit [Candidatus Hydrogenedentota bacterium]HOL76361.1 efflux RND transporter permease subunit [Candidatus Hydrogenedentota bacterium]HPO85399.1 efflux RND transporter permease subunit [Candidatus Hydrogenedentota bacterium]